MMMCHNYNNQSYELVSQNYELHPPAQQQSRGEGLSEGAKPGSVQMICILPSVCTRFHIFPLLLLAYLMQGVDTDSITVFDTKSWHRKHQLFVRILGGCRGYPLLRSSS